MRRLRHAKALTNQDLLRLEQPQALEVLHRRHVGAALEVLVEGRHAHVRPRSQCLDAQRLGVVFTQVSEGGADAREVPLLLDQRPQHPGLGPTQCGVQNLAHPRRPEHLGVYRVLQAA
ncbi:hypothetical protein D3C79_839300 [compost metagenome]